MRNRSDAERRKLLEALWKKARGESTDASDIKNESKAMNTIPHEYRLVQCPGCGVYCIVPESVIRSQEQDQLRGDGDDAREIVCTAGHAMVFTPAKPASQQPLVGEDLDKARRELLRLKHQHEQMEAEIEHMKLAAAGEAPPLQRKRGRPRKVAEVASEAITE